MIQFVSILVVGRVQHVGFRHFTIRQAEQRRINGFVKNQPDGSVYIEASGNESELDGFILEIGKGPAWARVDQIQVNKIPPFEREGFSARY